MEKIQWLEWSSGAFEKARREDKLVLLDIGAAWCHWCHVMDEECYGNPDIIKIVNKQYVPVRVETDKRPDLNDRYNQGGWPSTVILSPDGFVVHGATYLPPPALKELLKQARSWYGENKKRISDAARVIAAEASRVPPAAAPAAEPVKDLTDEIVENAMKNADRIHGGFGGGAKFPQPAALSLLLSRFYFTANEDLLEFAEKTLSNMSEGLHDKEEGGLFRYSVSPEWNSPHYEKNLNVNAECLQNYLDVYRLTGKQEYAHTAERIIDFARTKLWAPEGGFYGSQDADIFDEDSLQIVMEGEEYYKFSSAQRRKYDAPAIDKTIYTSWNSVMISALLEASFVLEKQEYRDLALKSLERLMKEGIDNKGGAFHYLEKESKGQPRFLGDNVALAMANLDAYEAQAENEFLKNAQRLMEYAQQRFSAPDGGFLDSVADENMPPATLIRHKPLHENMMAVEAFARLYNHTADFTYLKVAASILAAFEENVRALLSQDMGYYAAEYALGFRYVSEGSTKVAIIGARDDERTKRLHHEVKRLYRPAKIVQLLDPERDKTLIEIMKYPLEEKAPTVHICTEKGCAAPVRTVEEMLKLLVS